MMHFDIKGLAPRFIWNDKNGHAMAKAIESMLTCFLSTCQAGLDTWGNVSKMPEWRLDEMAWETNCLYDYDADIETKRKWIKDAIPLYGSLGTPKAVYNYLNGFWDQVELEENWQYSGDPFHFRVTVSGEWNDANEAWLRRAIEASKNVRSVLDDIALGSGTTIIVSGEGGVLARYGPPLTGDGLYAGTYPEESIISRIADDVYVIATRETKGHVFPYPQAGTIPEETTVGGFSASRITAASVAEGHVFPYPATSEEAQAGTRPEVNTIGAIADDVYVIATRETKGHVFPYPQAGTQPEETTVGGLGESRITAAPVAEGHVFPYPATSEEAQAGTRPEVNTIGAIANASAQTGTDGKATAFSYSPCTDENLCGEVSLPNS